MTPKPLLLVFAVFAGAVAGQTTTWQGTSSTDWDNAHNWSSGVPTSAHTVSIPAGRPFQPTLSVSGSCRTLSVAIGAVLTLAGRARLELFGSATASGMVTGTGVLVTSAPTSTLTGRFGNVTANVTTRLTTATSLSGSLNAYADVLVYSGCTLGSLGIHTGATVTIERNATISVVVSGGLNHAAGGVLDNTSSVPVVLRGTSHFVAGPIRGLLKLEVSAMTRFALNATITGDVTVAAAASQQLTIAGGGIGRIDGTATIASTSAGRCNIYLEDVQTGDVSLTVTNTWIAGTVTSAEFRVFMTQLRGVGTTDQLIVDTLAIPGSSQLLDSPPEFIVVRRGITINSSNTIAPVRGTIVFNDPVQPATVGVSDNPLPRLPEVRVENGAQVQFRSGPSNLSGRGPRIESLVVVNGTADAVFCTLDEVLVEPAGTLTVRTELPTDQCVVGPVTVRGAATFTDTDFGNATHANSLTVEGGGNALVGNGTLVITDTLRVASATLRLGAGVGLTVAAAGHLTLDGTPAAPAVVMGSNSPMQLDGRLDAHSFRVAGMDAAGLRVGAAAVFGPAPFDFRGGHFTGGRPGGVLLDLVRASVVTLFDLDFDNAGGATRNVRTTSASAGITIVDSRGNLAGEAFDDDPSNRVAWRGNATAVADLAAQPGVHRNVVSFRTTAEETTAFRLDRTPGGALGSFPASGPRTYAVVDDGLLAGTRYVYVLARQRLSPFAAEWQALGTVAATPHARDEGRTRFVGPNGYAGVVAALAGAPAGTIVFVATGTYGGFTIDRPARVIGEAGVRITSAVTVLNIVAGPGDVVLDGLDFDPGVPLTIADVAVPVVVRDVSLPGGGAFEGLRVERSPKVAVQRLVASSRATLVTATVHASSCMLGQVAVTATSRLVHAATTGTFTPDLGSTVTARPGPSAVLDLAPAWPSGTPQLVNVRQGGSGHPFGLLLSTAHDYLDLAAVLPVDMVLLLAPASLIALPGGVLDGSGAASLALPGPPNGGTVGQSLQLQVQTLDPTTVRVRFGEVRQVLFLR